MNAKVITAKQAALMVKSGSTLATDGFIGAAFAEELALEIENRFLRTGEPRDLTLIYAAGQGDAKDKGINHFGHEGLLRRVIGGHWGLAPRIQKLAIDEKIEAYNLPQGVICHMFRDIAAKKPGTLTHIGLKTFVDPRLGGGRLNQKTQRDIIEVMTIDDREYLLYKYLPIDFAILRGTTADSSGNVTMEKEALTAEMLSIAQAVKNSGGRVVVQVERIVAPGSLRPKDVIIPGIYVDAVVKATKPEYHMQTFGTEYNPAYCGVHEKEGAAEPAMDIQSDIARKIIGRRAAKELEDGAVVNLGIGIPEEIAQIAQASGCGKEYTLTIESGPIGGTPAGGLDFGCSRHPAAIIDQPYQFDFYQGGGLDIAFLGMAQADRHGNVNVSKFGPKIAGCGGFIDITQAAKKVVYCGTFTAKGLEIACDDGELCILREGRVKKLVEAVEQVTFSGEYAREKGQRVLFITERAVFELTKNDLMLTEIAPGIDLRRDILSCMSFQPSISDDIQTMDTALFDC